MVHELISATGGGWQNGAVGYYVRDKGMLKDNMANTTRIFLGTRIECAQCHNHPREHVMRGYGGGGRDNYKRIKNTIGK